MVRGSTRIYIIAGHPVSQVKSPEIFNDFFQQGNMDAVMIPLDIKPVGLSAFVECLRHAPNIHGSIVTIPYKEAITKYIDLPSPQVRSIGVANTLRVNKDGKIEGDMTDGRGFLNALAKKGITVVDKQLFIIGCGGAGAAVAWNALNAGARRVSLLDINNAKATTLKDKLSNNYPAHRIEVVSDPPFEFDIVLNATPIGMGPNDPLPMAIDKIPENAVVTDAVTSPSITNFLKEAQKTGHIIQSGPDMVDGQAPLIAEYFGIKWTGIL